ncbi:MAG: DUF3185 family protein [Phycisphaerales bacterium]|nr:DUF3185 family protein [Phycisphaerales bacterium]
MIRAIGFGLMAVGIVLLVLGFSASDSFASEVKEAVTGEPTERAIWYFIGGVASLVVGGAMAFVPMKKLRAA